MTIHISIPFSLQILVAFINLALLVVASIQDLKYREIQDKIWVIMLLLSLPLIILKIIIDKPMLSFYIYYGLNVFFGVLFGFVMFYSGAWGGADSKAIMALSVTYPFSQIIAPDPSCFMPPILGISINFLIFFFSLVVAFLGYNTVFYIRNKNLFQDVEGSLLQKIGVLVSGYKEKTALLSQKKFVDIAEDYVDGKWVLSSAFSKVLSEEEEKIEEENKQEKIKLLEKTGKKHVWVKPQPPGILFIFLAFLSYVLIGSPVLAKIIC